ncbi:hypothetical protein ABZS66_38130 [Dactylosporangium sp. NPDC005572]|uniref:hypothetical protein n=1 Tax=Dactylosporangium sp. NPDC005572 TaxID=3156889 RepID=UPI0033A8ABEB
MGFSGQFVVANSDQPLTTLDVFAGSVVLDRWREGSWQVLQLDSGDQIDPEAVLESTGTPCMFVHVYDSDVGVVGGLSLSGHDWSAVLDLKTAQDYGIPLDAMGISAHGEDIPAAVQWAAETGHIASAERLTHVLTKSADPFVESLFWELAEALGFSFRDDGAI